MKRCRKCHMVKALTDFYPKEHRCKSCAKAYAAEWAKRNPDKRAEYVRRAKPIQAAKTKAWREANREEYNRQMALTMKRIYARNKAVIDEFKAQGCSRCDEKRPICIDVHHHTARKSAHWDTVALRGKRVSLRRLRELLAKCVPLCSNCHRVLHDEERKLGLEVSRTTRSATRLKRT